MCAKFSEPNRVAVEGDGALHLSLGRIGLQSGGALEDAILVVKTFGQLNSRADNAVLIPTSFGASHREFEWMIGADSIFDPARYFIVIANLFGNGVSTSPSNYTALSAGQAFPLVTAYDNALVLRFAVERFLGVRRIAVTVGWSMGGQVAWHIASLFPNDVAHLVAICATARTSPHNMVFLEGARAVLQADCAYDPCTSRFMRPPERGLKALGRYYAGWALSQEFYRRECWRPLGYETLEAFLSEYWEASFMSKNADNLLAHIATWQAADISANASNQRHFPQAIRKVRARVLLLPASSDLYFTEEDIRAEAAFLDDVHVAPIISPWGHRAGNPLLCSGDRNFISEMVRNFISN